MDVTEEALLAEFESRGVVLPRGALNSIHADTVIEGPTALNAGIHNDMPVTIGAFTYSHSYITRNVSAIGRYCSIGPDVVFPETEHPTQWLSTSPFSYFPTHSPFQQHLRAAGKTFAVHDWSISDDDEYSGGVIIGNDVWIGNGAYIKGGVKLGDGCIIGTRAVVTKDVEPYAIVAGVPARVIKSRFPADLVADLLALRWWDFDYADLDGIDLRDVRSAVDAIRARKMSGELAPHRPLGRFGDLLQSALQAVIDRG